jgi:general secretion pathway protein G
MRRGMATRSLERRRLSPRQAASLGFSIIELMTVVVVMGGLSTLVVARTEYTVKQAKFARAIGDIRAIAQDVQGYTAATQGQALPPSLAHVDRDGLRDPWGRPYQYVNFSSGGTPRTDVFGVELNSEYDIYSLGPDGGPSIDDVILANDGGFIGRAARF